MLVYLQTLFVLVRNLVFIFSLIIIGFSEQRSLLEKCAATALSSKLIAGQKDFFSKLVVDAVSMLDHLLPLNMIGIKKVQGGSLEVSCDQYVGAYW